MEEREGEAAETEAAGIADRAKRRRRETMEKIVFLDRDGTLNEEVEYLHRPEDLRLIPGAAEAVRRFNGCGYKVVVVTNQAGVARGYYTEEEVLALHLFLSETLEKQGAHIDRFFYCPHHPVHGLGKYRADCQCRKPKPGLLRMAERYYQVDKSKSCMIGDKLLDVEAGRNYGIPGILVGTGYGKEIHSSVPKDEEERYYDFYAETLADAAEWIIKREGDLRYDA